ncbi:hypothetical protein B0E46_15680 [Rhodanobacter sp. B04]|uniref:hypothetical protein n=1 Tax=Rhodanobacter sp. B04 TaxID=1945860 RepID=UPI00098433F1|nr:hypothetical protein [Rhodanobacter sp. B04]OOG61418.1 hypothetical protein B0E46_15680 [Rhodanobacter sp. B04]
MSCLMEDLRTYSPEDQASIARVEMLLMQRSVKYYPSTLSKLTTVAEIIPPCADAVVVSPFSFQEICS